MTDTRKSLHGEWSSRFAFILAASGAAVGLGNIWKFPYITGENGGSAFVVVYVLCVLLIGIPVMMAESLMGRRGRRNPIETVELLTKEAGADGNWHYLGWLSVLAGLLILSYYSVIAGWTCSYTLKAFTGSFSNSNAGEIGDIFANLMASPIQLLFWHTLFMLATMLIVARGLTNGLERASQVLMPALFFALLFLIGYAMTTDGYQQGLHFLFTPDFSKLSGDSVLVAMGQAFFSLGLSTGSIMVYSAYLPKNVSIAQTSLYVAFADTLVALLAGLAIFPIVFANGLHPDSGPGLVFQTLPLAFGKMTGGWLFGILFFVMLVFAALSSSIAMIEPMVAWLMERKNLSRERACLWSGVTAWLLGFATVFSFNVWSNVQFFERSLFDCIDYLTANIMLPVGGFATAVFAGWMMWQSHTEEELALPTTAYRVWRVLIRYVAPAAIFFVFLHVVGVL